MMRRMAMIALSVSIVFAAIVALYRYEGREPGFDPADVPVMSRAVFDFVPSGAALDCALSLEAEPNGSQQSSAFDLLSLLLRYARDVEPEFASFQYEGTGAAWTIFLPHLCDQTPAVGARFVQFGNADQSAWTLRVAPPPPAILKKLGGLSLRESLGMSTEEWNLRTKAMAGPCRADGWRGLETYFQERAAASKEPPLQANLYGALADLLQGGEKDVIVTARFSPKERKFAAAILNDKIDRLNCGGSKQRGR